MVVASALVLTAELIDRSNIGPGGREVERQLGRAGRAGPARVIRLRGTAVRWTVPPGRTTPLPQAPAAAPPADPGALCLACGLCCDGTLFPRASLYGDEVAWGVGRGFDVARDDDGIFRFALPCPAFVGGCCSVYADGQPLLCSLYRCGVLSGYADGVISLDEGLDLVARLRAARRPIEVAMGLAPGGYTRAGYDRALAAAAGRHDVGAVQALELAFAPLRALDEAHFNPPFPHAGGSAAA